MKGLVLLTLIFAFRLVNSQTVKTDLTYTVSLPEPENKKTAVLILLHGWGGNETDLFDRVNELKKQMTIFALRAPFKPKEGGYCWYDIEFLKDAKFKYDYHQALESKIKIQSFISNACQAYNLDSTQVYIMGFSQGAIMGYDIAFTSPKKIKGVIAMSGRLMEESTKLQTDWSEVCKVHFFIAHGNTDGIIRVEEAEKANKFLESKNVVNAKYKRYEMPHYISDVELNDIKEWLTRSINSQ